MNLIFKSKLYREELLKWILIGSLLVWSLTTTFLIVQKKEKLVLIGIDDSGARVITDSNDRILQNELKSFFQSFLLNYYEYDEKTFTDQLELASNQMSSDLWNNQKPKLIELKEKLLKFPLKQTVVIDSIDLVDPQKIEALLSLHILSKISEKTVKIKVRLSFEKHPRSEENPWGYHITEVSDEAL